MHMKLLNFLKLSSDCVDCLHAGEYDIKHPHHHQCDGTDVLGDFVASQLSFAELK